MGSGGLVTYSTWIYQVKNVRLSTSGLESDKFSMPKIEFSPQNIYGSFRACEDEEKATL